MQLKHWKFVGWVDKIDTRNNTWIQRVVTSTLFADEEMQIEWTTTNVPLPDGAQEGTYVSVHRTKAGDWYAVNLSERMPRITESQAKRAKARAKRWARLVNPDSHPTED